MPRKEYKYKGIITLVRKISTNPRFSCRDCFFRHSKHSDCCRENDKGFIYPCVGRTNDYIFVQIKKRIK